MALVQKLNPVGVDRQIASFQAYLWSRVLVGGVSIAEWESYDRAYKNPRKGGLIPKFFTGGKDYKEVFYSDKFKMTSFFVAEDIVIMSGGDAVQGVSLIVQANIKEIYPAILHRADEELRNLFMSLSLSYYAGDSFMFNDVEMGIDNVYREFTQNDIKLEDMSEKHCFRLNYTVRYTPNCCTDC